MFPRLREVIQSPRFLEKCREIESDIRRLDSQLEGIIFAVARDPEAFTRVVENVYVIETISLVPHGEYVFIFFTIDDENTCTLRWIERGSDVVGVPNVVSVP